MALIQGKCMWAKVYEVDRLYAKEKTGGIWSIDMIVDASNEPLIQKEGLGHLINLKPDGTKTIKFKRNEFKKVPEGEANTPPKVVDAHKNPMTELIGNGSTVNVSFTTYEGFKSKTYPTLQTVQVVTLVPYKGKGKGDSLWDLEKIEGGYVSKADNDDAPSFEADVKGL